MTFDVGRVSCPFYFHITKSNALHYTINLAIGANLHNAERHKQQYKSCVSVHQNSILPINMLIDKICIFIGESLECINYLFEICFIKERFECTV